MVNHYGTKLQKIMAHSSGQEHEKERLRTISRNQRIYY